MFSSGIDPKVIHPENYLELPMEELNNYVLRLNGKLELKVIGNILVVWAIVWLFPMRTITLLSTRSLPRATVSGV